MVLNIHMFDIIRFIMSMTTLISFYLLNYSYANNSNIITNPANNLDLINTHNNVIINNSFQINSKNNKKFLKSNICKEKINFSESCNDIDELNNIQTNNGHILYNREYKNIIKGSYTGNSKYTVKYGDTLFYISWITGNNFYDLARKNNIYPPYNIRVGQILDIKIISNKENIQNNIKSNFNIDYSENILVKTLNLKKSSLNLPKISNENKNNSISKDIKKIINHNQIVDNSLNVNNQANVNLNNVSKYNWIWPTKGKVIEKFSPSIEGNKGIDISGVKGQSIFAAANGQVVYTGNALRGYGNLIIIKHNDNYLSAYAHNSKILVTEKQIVKSGQKIATMGSTGTNSTRLHFEIRYKGKSVDPLKYLPKIF